MPDPNFVGPTQYKPPSTSDNTGHQQHMVSASTPVGMFYDFVKTDQQNRLDSKRYRQAVRDNRANADVAYQRQRALMDKAEQYNSYQNKVSMLRQAGLNPALAFGDLSASVGAGSADQAAPVSPMSANAPDASIITKLPEALSVAEDIKQKQITNKYLDFKTSQEIFKMIAETNKMLADTSLTEEQRNNLLAFRDEQLNLLRAQTKSNTAAAEQSAATAAYTSGTLTDVGKSQVTLNEEKAKTEPVTRSNIAANTSYTKAKQVTEEEYTRPEIVSRTDLNKYSKSLTSEQIEALDRENSLSRTQKNMIDQWCEEHGYDPGVAKMIYQVFDESKVAVDKLSSWLDAGNWLPFVSNMVRNFSWKTPDKDDDIPPKKKSDNAFTEEDKKLMREYHDKINQLYSMPSDQNFNNHLADLMHSENVVPLTDYTTEGTKIMYIREWDWLRERAGKDRKEFLYKYVYHRCHNFKDFQDFIDHMTSYYLKGDELHPLKGKTLDMKRYQKHLKDLEDKYKE